MGVNFRGAIMELVGTFALCYVGGLSVKAGGLLNAALAHGFVLGFMVYAGAAVSGAHYNPAVTVALVLVRKCGVVDGCFYICTQFLGGLLAGLMLWTETDDQNCQCPSINVFAKEEYNIFTLFCMEMVATWFLVFAIMGTAVDQRAPKSIYGLCIGGTLTMCILGIGNFTGGALNPWRHYAPLTGTGDWDKASWIYIGPFAGAIIAAFQYNFIFLEDKVTEQEVDLRQNPELELKI